jgi:hypothetical protein
MPVSPPASMAAKKLAVRRRALIAAIMGAPLVSILLVNSPVPMTTRVIGWVLWVACLFPSWQYFNDRQSRPPVPFLPVVGLLYLMYYARPLAFGSYNQHWRIRVDPTSDYNYPAQLALEGWLMLLFGWYVARPRIRRAASHSYNVKRIRTLALILAWFGPIGRIAQSLPNLPIVVAGPVQFLSTLAYFGLGLLMMIVASNRRDLVAKITLIITTVSLVALQVASGFISQFLVTAAVLIFSYWAVKGRLNPILIFVGVVITSLTFLVKSTLVDYRKVAWTATAGMSNEAKLSLMTRLTSQRIDKEGWTGAISSGSKSSAVRSANMDLLAEVVRRTPQPVPYWGGQTYVSLIGLAVPRFLWPDKPTKELGQAFGHRYSLLDPQDTHTSFNLPFLIEFYANFGEMGIIVGMLIVGLIYGVLARRVNRHGQDAVITMTGIVLLLPLLNIESDFSLNFGGLVLNGSALWCLIRLLRSKSTPRKTKPHATVR